jgi:anti-sigma regulatory factor (Ser/Thr protein kinase)
MVEIIIVNRGSELPRVAGLVDRLGAEHKIASDVLADMQIALDEVLTNVIDYGYADDAQHQIGIRLQVVDDVFEATIEDDGTPFNPLAGPAPDLQGPLHERKLGGLGLHFVRKLMTEVTYDRVGERNRLVLRKRFRK